MSKFEKWMRLGLIVISLVFAGFLSALGDKLLSDADRFYVAPESAQFQDSAKLKTLKDEVAIRSKEREGLTDQVELLEKSLGKSVQAYASKKETYSNWLEARGTTDAKEQNGEVIARVRSLDAMKADENAWRQRVSEAEDKINSKNSEIAVVQSEISKNEGAGYKKYSSAMNTYRLRLFAVRLVSVLPLLVLGAWLFVRKRKGSLAPLVWGYILFSLFLFFFGLVPYLPSFGGYVWAAGGALITALLGYYLTNEIGKYRKQLAVRMEASAKSRVHEISNAKALKAYQAHSCPSCDKDFRVGQPDGIKQPRFCPQCGLGLFGDCGQCRSVTFIHFAFCWNCGLKQLVT